MCFPMGVIYSRVAQTDTQNLPHGNTETAQKHLRQQLVFIFCQLWNPVMFSSSLDQKRSFTSLSQRQHWSRFVYQLIQDWLCSRQRKKCRRNSLALALISLSKTVKKKIFRLILLFLSENHWFNSNMCGTHSCAIPALSYTHRAQLQQEQPSDALVSHPGQRTFPFLLPTDYFRYNLFKNQLLFSSSKNARRLSQNMHLSAQNKIPKPQYKVQAEHHWNSVCTERFIYHFYSM